MTFFDQLHHFFKDNIAVLGPVFCRLREIPATIDRNDSNQLTNLHEAMINDLKNGFMSALGRDRIYKRQCGSVTDQ